MDLEQHFALGVCGVAGLNGHQLGIWFNERYLAAFVVDISTALLTKYPLPNVGGRSRCLFTGNFYCLVGDHVHVCVRAVSRTEKRFHYVQFLVNDDKDVLSASCEFVGAHIDMKVRRMSAIPDQIAAVFDQMVEQHNQLDWQPPLCGSMHP